MTTESTLPLLELNRTESSPNATTEHFDQIFDTKGTFQKVLDSLKKSFFRADKDPKIDDHPADAAALDQVFTPDPEPVTTPEPTPVFTPVDNDNNDGVGGGRLS